MSLEPLLDDELKVLKIAYDRHNEDSNFKCGDLINMFTDKYLCNSLEKKGLLRMTDSKKKYTITQNGIDWIESGE